MECFPSRAKKWPVTGSHVRRMATSQLLYSTTSRHFPRELAFLCAYQKKKKSYINVFTLGLGFQHTKCSGEQGTAMASDADSGLSNRACAHSIHCCLQENIAAIFVDTSRIASHHESHPLSSCSNTAGS